MDSEATIQLQDLTTGYRVRKQQKLVSTRLNGQLYAGQLTCLLGPNGAGKSTLLRTLAVFQPALGGQVLLERRPVNTYRPKDLARKVSVVLTHNDDIRGMTAEEVVAIGRSPYTGFWGRLSGVDKQAVTKCLRWTDMLDLRHRKMETLSDGERQKVMISKALAQETPVVLLDEPTAFLDYPSKVQMMLLLARLAHALHKTVLLSTHDVEHALQVADTLWLLDQEHGLTCGTPRELSDDGSIARYFEREGITFQPEQMTFRIERTDEATTVPQPKHVAADSETESPSPSSSSLS